MLRKLLNVVLFFVVCALIGTGLGMEFETSRHTGDLHFALAVTFIILLCLHLYMGRAWIVKILGKGNIVYPLAGIMLGVLLIVAFMFVSPGSHGEGNHKGEHHQERHGQIDDD